MEIKQNDDHQKNTQQPTWLNQHGGWSIEISSEIFDTWKWWEEDTIYKYSTTTVVVHTVGGFNSSEIYYYYSEYMEKHSKPPS